jgi:hypothetical protein
MANRRISFIDVLRTKPDVRREFALTLGVLILGYCIHSWIDSSLIATMAESMPPAQAANLGGLIAGAVAVVVGVTFGWLAGRWLIEFQYPVESKGGAVENQKPTHLSRLQGWFDSYPLSRGLVLGGVALVVGAALGYWLLLATLVMVLAFSTGYWGRTMALRTVDREF